MRVLDRILHRMAFGEPRLGPARVQFASRAKRQQSQKSSSEDLLDHLAASAADLHGKEGVDFLLQMLRVATALARRLDVELDCHRALVGANPDALVHAARLQAITARLTNRQRQTLALLLKGRSKKEIADELYISEHTVHEYAKALHERFGVETRAELLSLWIKAEV